MATNNNHPTQNAEPTPYERYEDEIIALLQMPGVDVRALPTTETIEAPRPTARPMIYVLVNGGEFAEREDLAVVSQLETIQCECFFRAKNRRGQMGLFDVATKAKQRLLGHRMQGAKTPIYFNSFGYVSGIQNCWQYALTFSFAAYSIEADKTGTAPIIKKITHEFNPR